MFLSLSTLLPEYVYDSVTWICIWFCLYLSIWGVTNGHLVNIYEIHSHYPWLSRVSSWPKCSEPPTGVLTVLCFWVHIWSLAYRGWDGGHGHGHPVYPYMEVGNTRNVCIESTYGWIGGSIQLRSFPPGIHLSLHTTVCGADKQCR